MTTRARVENNPVFRHVAGEPNGTGPLPEKMQRARQRAAKNPRWSIAVPFVDLHADYLPIKEQVDRAFREVLERADFIMGREVAEFESSFAAYCGVDHGVGVDSGFSAIELILRAYEIGPGDEVITAANTFIATVTAIDITGARPVLVDIDPDSYNLDPERVAEAITPATRAIIAVHLYGHPADMDGLRAVADEFDLLLVEDACQAHGARYRGRRTGGLGDAAAFSFYPSKNLGAFGDGGLVATNDVRLADRVRMLRNLGTSEKYHHDIKGFNRRLDTLHAAVLQAKLPHLDDRNESRSNAAAIYQDQLDGLPITTPIEAAHVEHVYHLYVVQVIDRSALQKYLIDLGIATGIHYPIPVHLQTAYRFLGYEPGSFPITEAAASRILSLPMYPGVTADALAHTTESIRSFYTE